MSREQRLNEIQLRARSWLIRNDPTPEMFWGSVPLGSDFVDDVRQNLRDFGPHAVGTRIVREWERIVRDRAG